MNILLTEKCTNYCYYCFAKEKMAGSAINSFISIDAFKKILDFLCGSKLEHVNLIGGEPLIHPDIVKIIEMLNSSPTKNISIFTGGIVSSKKIKQLSDYLLLEKYNFIFNLNNKGDYLKNHYSRVLTNIKYLRDLGFNITIGYNIYKEDFNYLEIFEVCDYLGIHKIRWSLAYPGIKRDTQFIHPPRYIAIRDRVYKFIIEAYKRNLELSLDCQLPLCFFTEKQLSKIFFIYPQFRERFGKCFPAIDIGVNLNVWRCFALYDDINGNLEDFKDIKEIYKFFKTKTDSHLYTEPPNQCINCEYWKDNLCQGGCLSFNIDLINKSRQRKEMQGKIITTEKNITLLKEPLIRYLSDSIEDEDALLKTIYFILEKEGYDIIGEFYNHYRLRLFRLRNPIILYLISIAFVNKKDKKNALAIISEGLRMSQGSNLRQKFKELIPLIKNDLESFKISSSIYTQISGIQ